MQITFSKIHGKFLGNPNTYLEQSQFKGLCYNYTSFKKYGETEIRNPNYLILFKFHFDTQFSLPNYSTL